MAIRARRVVLGVAAVLLVAAGLALIAGSPAGATTISAGTEADYRAALTTLSGDNAGPHVIELTADFSINPATDPTYTGSQDLTINGNGHTFTATAGQLFLFMDSTAQLTLNDITLTGFNSNGNGGAVFTEGSLIINDSTFTDNDAGEGGGVVTSNLDSGQTTIRNSTFTGNTAQTEGGAIRADGTATVTGSRFTDNHAGVVYPGGALYAVGDVTVTDTGFSDNTAGSDGGAIHSVDGSVNVDPSSFIGNSAANGGAIDAPGPVTAIETTFLLNTADNDGGAINAGGVVTSIASTFGENEAVDEGGAITSQDDVTLTNSTVSGNTGGDDIVNGDDGNVSLTYATVADNTVLPGGAALDTDDSDFLESFGSVVANTVDGDNCGDFGATTSTGHNRSTDATCGFTEATDEEDAGDPELEALGDFGGPTPTRPPLVTSPLVDAIPEADCLADPAVDQRGVSRPQDGNLDGTVACDIGAVEILVEEPEGPVAAAPPFTG